MNEFNNNSDYLTLLPVNHVSMQTALTRLSSEFDITSTPSMEVISRLAEYAKNTQQKLTMESLGTNEDEYAAWKESQTKGFLGLLKEYTSTDINMADLFDILDFIKPRW